MRVLLVCEDCRSCLILELPMKASDMVAAIKGFGSDHGGSVIVEVEQ